MSTPYDPDWLLAQSPHASSPRLQKLVDERRVLIANLVRLINEGAEYVAEGLIPADDYSRLRTDVDLMLAWLPRANVDPEANRRFSEAAKRATETVEAMDL